MTISDQAEPAELTLEDQLQRRRVPCICPRQHEPKPPIGVSQGFSESRGHLVERVKCSDCERCWTRIEAQ